MRRIDLTIQLISAHIKAFSADEKEVEGSRVFPNNYVFSQFCVKLGRDEVQFFRPHSWWILCRK